MRSIELFAGCGGLGFGIAEAGFEHVLVVENDARACATLRFNAERGVNHFRDWRVEQVDVRDVDFSRMAGTIDLVSGGPPCQPFSIGGKHKGPTDQRNMWPEAIRAVRESRPKAFVFENVRGLLRPAFSDYLDFIRLQLSYPSVINDGNWRIGLEKLGKLAEKGEPPEYHVVIQGINAADYGVPQKRHRAIVMGVRSDIATHVVFPRPTHSREALVWSQRITGEYWRRHGVPENGRPRMTASDRQLLKKLKQRGIAPAELPWVTVRDVISNLPKPSKKETVLNHLLHPGARSYAGHTGSVLDGPAKALKAGAHGVPGGENSLVIRSGKVRYFTVREMARLHGLPDEFGTDESWVSSIKQLGNAVPVQVGRTFGRAIVTLVEEVGPRSNTAVVRIKPNKRTGHFSQDSDRHYSRSNLNLVDII
ncbi:MAG: DNA (cytosine-5-)-methyltransferase [Patescibacteria group bacterium]|nr:DNA (cytosine-5-)-methyltransferase [Patescibacteria group bacterium]MDE1944859.1 DNA (cytosine-5-)-methyltransferase [Patescibacteria group bacterium]MDE2057305.1 DNA (cytosine-5-)-methyltransferase [Patescibacteria group bacterium]